ncbi:MAG TPA: hypothetical protein V6D14_06465 [Coleofasciculaceae cyanobacterium]
MTPILRNGKIVFAAKSGHVPAKSPISGGNFSLLIALLLDLGLII